MFSYLRRENHDEKLFFLVYVYVNEKLIEYRGSELITYRYIS